MANNMFNTYLNSLILSLILLLIPLINGQNGTELLNFAVKQYERVAKELKLNHYPVEGHPTSTVWKTTTAKSWTSGFYPGILWHLYNYTAIEKWKLLAIESTDGLYEDQFLNSSHDIGFMIMCSYGNGYEFTQNSSYPIVIETAASTLAERFNPLIGCTRSWNSHTPEDFIVIVDNMMNLELFFKAWKLSGNETYYDMAVSHANKTIKEHIRNDFSSYHVVEYNETTGEVIRKRTAQGYADWSCWSRGQAWLISGFTTAYRYTKLEHFLETAKGVAKYYIDNLPEDGIAYWDFNVPHDSNHTYIPRDTSSAAIAASGLLELYEHTSSEIYSKTARKIINSLFSAKYRSDGKHNYKIPALFLNGTTVYKRGDYDTSIIYGDYYFTKAIRYFL